MTYEPLLEPRSIGLNTFSTMNTKRTKKEKSTKTKTDTNTNAANGVTDEWGSLIARIPR